MRKRFVGCILLFLLCGCCAFAEEKQDTPDSSNPAAAGTEGYAECEGFESPQDAVSACLEAMQEQNVGGIVSTFATKTYIDHLDAKKVLERYRSFNPMMYSGIDMKDDYVKQIGVGMMYQDIIKSLYYQYLFYSWPDYLKNDFGNVISLGEENEIDQFIESQSSNDIAENMKHMKIIEFVEPSSLTELYLTEQAQKNFANQAQVISCDELTDVPVHIQLGDTDYMMFIQCVRYGEKWYNSQFGGNLASMLGVSTFCGGLVPYSEFG